MEITLNHTIVPAFNNVESAKFYEHIFGFEFVKEWGHFAVVKVSSTLTLDFQNKEDFSSIHYAFKVSDEQFDQIFARIQNSGMAYGSEPYDLENAKINHKYGGRGVKTLGVRSHFADLRLRKADKNKQKL